MLGSQIDILASLISGDITHALARHYIHKFSIGWQLRLAVPGMKALQLLLQPPRLIAIQIELSVEPPADDQIGLIVAKLQHAAAAKQRESKRYEKKVASTFSWIHSVL